MMSSRIELMILIKMPSSFKIDIYNTIDRIHTIFLQPNKTVLMACN